MSCLPALASSPRSPPARLPAEAVKRQVKAEQLWAALDRSVKAPQRPEALSARLPLERVRPKASSMALCFSPFAALNQSPSADRNRHRMTSEVSSSLYQVNESRSLA